MVYLKEMVRDCLQPNVLGNGTKWFSIKWQNETKMSEIREASQHKLKIVSNIAKYPTLAHTQQSTPIINFTL